MKKTFQERKKLNEIFDDWYRGGGIFTALSSIGMPWDEYIDPQSMSLDFAYHGGYSGEKFISPFVENVVKVKTVHGEAVNLMANAINEVFGQNWSREWETMIAEYNPIENYSMVEQMTNDTTTDAFGHTNTRTLDTEHSKTGTVETDESSGETRTDDLTTERTADLTHTKTGTEATAPAVTLTEQENTFGFNTVAQDGEPTRKKTQTSAGTNTTTYNTTEKDTGTDTTTQTGTVDVDRSGGSDTTYNTTDADSGTVTDAESGQNTRTRNYRLTRSGNIGTTTSQMMLQSERDLWVWNFFYKVVFPDVDYMLTIPVY